MPPSLLVVACDSNSSVMAVRRLNSEPSEEDRHDTDREASSRSQAARRTDLVWGSVGEEMSSKRTCVKSSAAWSTVHHVPDFR
jgi:hypothetical protein